MRSKRGDVAVHGEDTVRRDQASAASPAGFELALEVLHVAVGIPEPLGTA